MPADILLQSTVEGVTTLTMNNPRKLNGWTEAMLGALLAALEKAGEDDATKALILTGKGDYYCAGVNLSGALQLDHPKKLRAMIIERNQKLFDTFLRFPKPILIAVNGPAIGACVTSATLCDGIIASDRATFSTPFAKLGVPPEGCSSEVFPKLLGRATADRILGAEGWKPNAEQAREIGMVGWVVPHDQLIDEAQRIAKQWVDEGRERSYPAGFTRAQLEAVNARESEILADAFLSPPFLMGQYRFLRSKNKLAPAAMFLALRLTRPAWSLLL